MENLTIHSSAFQNGGGIPLRHTARGEDVSPDLQLSGIAPETKSIAVLLDDMTHPLFGVYCHWAIWNLPAADIPEAIPRGRHLPGGAVQGVGYGKHRYKGPKPPRGARHTYRFAVYTLDCLLSLGSGAGKRKLLAAMEGQILQRGEYTGIFETPAK